MFNILKSNQMENLMGALTSVLEAVPDNPLMFEWIGIQSKGMKQWVALIIFQGYEM
ncbi:exodeoxyribonuclease V subunit gamma [Desulfobacula sp.]